MAKPLGRQSKEAKCVLGENPDLSDLPLRNPTAPAQRANPHSCTILLLESTLFLSPSGNIIPHPYTVSDWTFGDSANYGHLIPSSACATVPLCTRFATLVSPCRKARDLRVIPLVDRRLAKLTILRLFGLVVLRYVGGFLISLCPFP